MDAEYPLPLPGFPLGEPEAEVGLEELILGGVVLPSSWVFVRVEVTILSKSGITLGLHIEKVLFSGSSQQKINFLLCTALSLLLFNSFI